MRDDGGMARLDDLTEFARAHGLKIGTIRDLIAYRLKKDHMVERVADSAFTAASGAKWQAQVFRDKATNEEQLALVHGTLDPERPVLVRMHSLDLFSDVLGEAGPRSALLQGAMREIEEEGAGVVVALHAAAPGSLSRALDVRSGKPAEAGDARAQLRHRRADPRRARNPRHDPADQHAPLADRAVGLRPRDRRRAADPECR